jgi:ArsR family transcriptional regulator
MGRGPLDDEALMRALKALADPTRFQMMQELAAAGELSCGEIAERFEVSQPTVSHHLKVLLDAGLLVSRRDGKHNYTSVDTVLVARLARMLPARLGGLSRTRTATRTRTRTG